MIIYLNPKLDQDIVQVLYQAYDVEIKPANNFSLCAKTIRKNPGRSKNIGFWVYSVIFKGIETYTVSLLFHVL